MPAEPPVASRGEAFERAQLSWSAVDELGRPVDLPKGLTIETHLRPPHQFDGTIEAIIDKLQAGSIESIGRSWTGKPTEQRTAWLIEFGEVAGAMGDALYAFRYHQRQFFARLRIVTSQYAFAYDTSGGRRDSTIRFADGPLEFELAAVLIRSSSVLDALAKYAAFLWGTRPTNWSAWRKKLESPESIRERERAELRRLVRHHERWLTANATLRNAIVHESRFPGFGSVGTVGSEILDAEVDGVAAGALVTRTWVGLRELVPAVAGVVAGGVVRPS